MPHLHRSQIAPPARRRRTFLSREEIIVAAATILNRDGYDAVNMRSIGAELGVQAAALYRYVASREQLDDLLFDHLMAGCTPVVAGRDWREDLRSITGAWRARLLDRRDITRIALGQISIGPNVAPLMEACLSALRRSGLNDDGVLDPYETCILFVHGLARSEAIQRGLTKRGGDAQPRDEALEAENCGSYPTLVALASRLAVPTDFDAAFAFGMDALIAGIERRALIV